MSRTYNIVGRIPILLASLIWEDPSKFKATPDKLYYDIIEEAINTGELEQLKYYKKRGTNINKPIYVYKNKEQSSGYRDRYVPYHNYSSTFLYILQHPSGHKDKIIDYYIKEVINQTTRDSILNHYVMTDLSLFKKFEQIEERKNKLNENPISFNTQQLEACNRDNISYDRHIVSNKLQRDRLLSRCIKVHKNLYNTLTKEQLKKYSFNRTTRTYYDCDDEIPLFDYVAACYPDGEVFKYLLSMYPVYPITEKTVINYMYFSYIHNDYYDYISNKYYLYDHENFRDSLALLEKVTNLKDFVNKEHMNGDMLTYAIKTENWEVVDKLLECKELIVTSKHIDVCEFRSDYWSNKMKEHESSHKAQHNRWFCENIKEALKMRISKI